MDGEDNIENPSPNQDAMDNEMDMGVDSPAMEDMDDGIEPGSQEEGTEGEAEEGIEGGSQEEDGAGGPNGAGEDEETKRQASPASSKKKKSRGQMKRDAIKNEKSQDLSKEPSKFVLGISNLL
jgi:hypothetical protein